MREKSPSSESDLRAENHADLESTMQIWEDMLTKDCAVI